MNISETITQLQQFRQELYQLLPARRDALMELLDALCSSPQAQSVVELSLSPLFRREYGSLSDAIAHFFQAKHSEQAEAERRAWDQEITRLLGRYVPAPQQRRYWLLGTDVTPLPRPFARTLADRGVVYQPNPVVGNKPITLGHAYSALVYLPEKVQPDEPPWVIPLHLRRVHSQAKSNVVGADQLGLLLEDPSLPFHTGLCVHVADSAYQATEFLGRVGKQRQLVSVTRAAENRVFYRQASSPSAPRQGHPCWYGERFDLKDATTWGAPDETAETTWTSKRGRTYRVCLQGWHNLLKRGQRDLPMHRYPFTLIRAVVLDELGQPVFKRALWLVVLGQRRGELSLVESWLAYGQRYDLEHYFRFGKQRLLLTAYQTPDTEHEENWVALVGLATMQLWLGRELTERHPRPWERYLPPRTTRVASPSQVQRDWERIIRLIGTPAQPPKRRGKAPGRAKGVKPGRRDRLPVVKKSPRSRQTVLQLA
jgi:hypothetical protein